MMPTRRRNRGAPAIYWSGGRLCTDEYELHARRPDGKFVELWATDRYSLTLDYPVVDGLKFDATDEDGRPWDVKGSR